MEHGGSEPGALGLVERDRELAAVNAVLVAAKGGAGTVVVVEGPAGIGKTRLLDAARVRAGSQGIQVLAGSGGEFEHDVAFGLVRQLFERLLTGADKQLRAQLLSGSARLAGPLLLPVSPALSTVVSGEDAPSAVRHGLYWLTANLAERAPLLIVVDDAQWIDLASAGWLAYLARRVGELPVVMALGVRTDEPDPTWWAALEAGARMERIELQPLSQPASATLVRKLLGPSATPGLCLACHEATGGNPFLLGELVKVLASEGLPAGTGDLAQVTPRRVSRFVLARLARLGPDAEAVAAAVAVLGEGARLRHVAALAELDQTGTARAADALLAARILAPTPLGFVHPLVRAAVHNALPPAGRAHSHARAAALLAADQADTAAVAAHLLAAEPVGDQQVVAWLRQAGQNAVATGAPKMAAVYLARALAEPPDAGVRADVLHELGSAELLGRQPAAIARLAQARDATSDPRLRTRISVELGQGLIRAGRLAEAGTVLDQAAQELGDHPIATLAGLELYRCALGVWRSACAPALASRIPALRQLAYDAGPAGRPLALALAYHDVLAGASPSEVVPLVERGLDQGRLIRSGNADGMALSFAVRTLTFLDELDRASALVDEMTADAARRGSVMSYAAASIWRAGVALSRGSVRVAEAEARSALALVREHGLGLLLPYATAFLGQALVEQGELDAAARALGEADPAAMGGTQPEAALLYARAWVALARRETSAAAADLRACQAIEEALGLDNPNALPWRSALAAALSATAPEQAHALIEAELGQARRIGQPRAVGVALRAQALLAQPGDAPGLLRQAVGQLARCPARLEQARALTDLGASLRRLGQRNQAKEPLEAALDLAYRCGAAALVERAHSELLCCGARPRRPVRTGVDALTAAELRVAEMATAAMSNREIAQALFVSMRTVATHLGHAYQKLAITGRAELPAALGTAAATPRHTAGANPATVTTPRAPRPHRTA